MNINYWCYSITVINILGLVPTHPILGLIPIYYIFGQITIKLGLFKLLL